MVMRQPRDRLRSRSERARKSGSCDKAGDRMREPAVSAMGEGRVYRSLWVSSRFDRDYNGPGFRVTRAGFAPMDAMIGRRLGQYSIDARLGAGGMGVVYRARDERLQRTVAIKFVGEPGTGSTPDERNRLLDEARAASHLSHPHICTVYE